MSEKSAPSPFDSLLNLSKPEIENDDLGDESGSSEKVPVVKPSDYRKLQSELKNSQEQIRQLTEEFQKVSGSTEEMEVLKKLKAAFQPTTDKDDLQLQKQLLERFDDDPISLIRELVNSEVAEVKNKLQETNLDIRAKEVTNEIDKEYEVDWSKDSAKIIEQLNSFSREYKMTNPREATIKAMRLAGVGKKRIQPLPFSESPGGMYTPGRAPAQSEEITKTFLKGLRKEADAAKGSPIASLFKSGSTLGASRRK